MTINSDINKDNQTDSTLVKPLPFFIKKSKALLEEEQQENTAQETPSDKCKDGFCSI